MNYQYPENIICLTEETVEIIYDLGLEHLIAGVSIYVERPIAAKSKPRVSAFTSTNLKKVAGLNPDLIIGFSDIQKDIARDLIGMGLNCLVTNQRSIEEILKNIFFIGNIIGAKNIHSYLEKLKETIENFRYVPEKRPKIYFEEWDEPMISAIQWVSEAIELTGGKDIFSDRSHEKLAKGRYCQQQEVIERNPDIIFACHCGKKVKISTILERKGWENINAIKNKQVYELDPAIFLQPGPALIKSGLEVFNKYIKNWEQNE